MSGRHALSPKPGITARRLRHALVVAVVTALLAIGFWVIAGPNAEADAEEVTVYKSPWCGCCGAWVDHLRENGFAVTVHETEDLGPIKQRHGVPAALGSCHTAEVGGYTIEGHVPAADINRLLREQPDGRGLAVPGMPMGSPGMEGPHKDPYDVLLFDDEGDITVFSHR